MNTYAYKTTASLYANAAAEKRAACANTSQGLFHTCKQERSPNRKSIPRKGNGPRDSVDSIIRLFGGTIVTDYTAGIEWGVQAFDIVSGS